MEIDDIVRVTIDNNKVIKFVDSVGREKEICDYKFIVGIVNQINDGSFVVSFNHYIDNDMFEYKQLQNKSETIEVSNDINFGNVVKTSLQYLSSQATKVIEEYYFYAYETSSNIGLEKGNGIWRTRISDVVEVYNAVNAELKNEYEKEVLITAFNKI